MTEAICSEEEASAGGALQTIVAPPETAVFMVETGTARNRKRVKYMTASSGTDWERHVPIIKPRSEPTRKTAAADRGIGISDGNQSRSAVRTGVAAGLQIVCSNSSEVVAEPCTVHSGCHAALSIWAATTRQHPERCFAAACDEWNAWWPTRARCAASAAAVHSDADERNAGGWRALA